MQGPPVQTQTYADQTPTSTRPTATYGYDTFGDRTQVVDPDNNRTDTSYDGDGRVTSVTQPPYTPPGGPAAITEPTTYAYDENGRGGSTRNASGCEEPDSAAVAVRAKVAEMQAAMTQGEAGRATYAAAHVTSMLGFEQIWVAAAGKSGYVRPAIRGDAFNMPSPA